MWPVQVIGHDDTVESASFERPGVALEVGGDDFRAIRCGQIGDARCVTVDRGDAVTQVQQVAGVAAAATGEVEDPAPPRDSPRMAFNPRGWPIFQFASRPIVAGVASGAAGQPAGEGSTDPAPNHPETG
jgi:hypothetical protein